jgi:integrase
MRGTVIKRGKSWSIVVEVGRDPVTGRRIRKWHSGYKTRREAEKARTELLSRLDHGTYVEPDKRTLLVFLRDEWLPAVRSTVRPGTFSEYELIVNRRVGRAVIGGETLQQVTPAALNAFYADLLAGAPGRRSLSPKSVRNVHGVLHKAFADAVRWGRVLRNVADAADPPRAQRPEMKTWSPAQLRTFLEQVRGDRMEAAWVLITTTGMRRGEVLGLRWSDIDLDLGVARIVQTLGIVDYELSFGEPKTAKGRRSIVLDGMTVAALRSHRVRQLEERLAVGGEWTDQRLVFCAPSGDPINPQRFSQWFAQHARHAGLPSIRLHDVRHSYASAALEGGIHPKIVSERLGHANVGITLDTYSHVSPTMQRDAAERVAGLIFGEG